MDIHIDTTIKSLLDNRVISVRTYNCLKHVGYETIGEILASIEKPMDLLKIRNFGMKSLTEFNSLLVRVQKYPMPKVASVEAQPIYDCIEKSYNSIINADNKLSPFISSKYVSSQSLHNSIMRDLNVVLYIESKLNLEENISLRKLYLRFITETIANIEQQSLMDNSIYPKYKSLETELGQKINEFSLYERMHYFISPQVHEHIEDVYQRMGKSVLTHKARSFLINKFPKFESLIGIFDKPYDFYQEICPGRKSGNIAMEIYQFSQKFKGFILGLSGAEIDDLTIKKKYPFLLSRHRSFVKNYISQRKHAPLFFICYEYLRVSINRTDKIFCMKYGFFDNKKRSLAEIAIAFDLTRERVRQILKSKTTIQKRSYLFNDDLNHYKDLIGQPFVCELSNSFLHLRQEEQLSFSFEIFAAILSLVGDFRLIEINDHTIAINNKSTLAEFDIDGCISKIESLISSKYAQETRVPITYFFNSQSVINEEAKQLILFILVTVYNLTVIDERIVFTQNYIDISEELFQILLEKGEPMTVSDMFVKFKEKYPEHHYIDPSQIKPYLYKNEHIRSIGRMSLYGLDFWKNFYYGSIRDLMFEIINNSDAPVHVGEIYEKVKEYFPETNIKSIASSMQSDSANRFVLYQEGYFGINGKDYGDKFSQRSVSQRYSFEERMKGFKEFVDTYHRFPLSNGGEEEAALRRWYYNVENCVIEAPSEAALDEFLGMIDEYNKMGYPRTGFESEFLNNCEKYQNFINTNYKLPTIKNGGELYWWFKRSLDNYDSYVDHRRLYLTSLINYVRSMGFSI